MTTLDQRPWCASGFEPVATAFAENFDKRGEIGASFSAFVDGHPVVDLWGGIADPASQRPWERDTLALGFSMTKGVTATCANLLVERGQLDPHAPVASYWPEFAARGKQSITVEQLLSHQAGLPVIEGNRSLDEALSWAPVVDQLASQTPLWEPGTAHGYHLRSFGWLAGEIVRRVSGMTLGTFLECEIARPLELDLWVGLPEAFEPRLATLIPPPQEFRDLLRSLPADMWLGRATTGPSGHFNYDESWNERHLHACELPSSNGIGTARAFARLYAGLVGTGVDGRRVLSATTVQNAARERVRGADRILMRETAFGLGYMLPPTLAPAAGARAFGHAGAGGSVAFADPERGLACCYLMNHMRFDPKGEPRAHALVQALYACVDTINKREPQ